jgi:predicted transcriptional regulator
MAKAHKEQSTRITTNINVKFIEVLTNLVREQNMQLIQIIAEEEKLSYLELAKLVPSTYQLKKELANLETSDNNC